jgi:hypothetical protein
MALTVPRAEDKRVILGNAPFDRTRRRSIDY